MKQKKSAIHLKIAAIFSFILILISCKNTSIINLELKYKNPDLNYYHTLTLLDDGIFNYYLSNAGANQNEEFFIELITGTYELGRKSFILNPLEMKMYVSSGGKIYDTSENYSNQQKQNEFTAIKGRYTYKKRGSQILIIDQNGTPRIFEAKSLN